jgi:hypothetical protein
MNNNDHHWSRRDFLKITGAAGIGSIAGSMTNIARASNASDSDAPGSSRVPPVPSEKPG